MNIFAISTLDHLKEIVNVQTVREQLEQAGSEEKLDFILISPEIPLEIIPEWFKEQFAGIPIIHGVTLVYTNKLKRAQEA